MHYTFPAILLFAAAILPPSVIGEEWGGVQTSPSESECRPYIEKALKELGTTDGQEVTEVGSEGGRQSQTDLNEPIEQDRESAENLVTKSTEDETENAEEATKEEEAVLPESREVQEEESDEESEKGSDDLSVDKGEKSEEENDEVSAEERTISTEEMETSSKEGEVDEEISSEEVNLKENEASSEDLTHEEGKEVKNVTEENEKDVSENQEEGVEPGGAEFLQEESVEALGRESAEHVQEESVEAVEIESAEDAHEESVEAVDKGSIEISQEESAEDVDKESVGAAHGKNVETLEGESLEVAHEESIEAEESSEVAHEESVKAVESLEVTHEESVENIEEESAEESAEIKHEESPEISSEDKQVEQTEQDQEVSSEDHRSENIDESKTNEERKEDSGEKIRVESGEKSTEKEESVEESSRDETVYEKNILESSTEREERFADGSMKQVETQITEDDDISKLTAEGEESKESKEAEAVQEEVSPEEEDLILAIEIPQKLRPRDHIAEILRLGNDSVEVELLLSKVVDGTLRELKRLYESAIKPLEILYKYRDLSNRHFGDPEIFSKPLILFMGPWSGGKSTIINYLLDNEYKKSALRTGAEPSPAYFNIVMWGEMEEVLDGTQLAADWTFSGLQKFGQGLLDRLRGLKLNNPLLEKVNIVEIPGILEIRKQVERLFPFNDACQWFIDRADIIFLVYDPSKLDVGPESEAILDQLKGREYQTRIILNKADQVKPEELMRVQGTLIWNISPLMSSTEPPVMYSTSLWSLPYESGAPTRLLYAQEKAFLRDLKDAVDKRVENKISSARRFAVRVRNHAKMVDCYLTTYYNHKTFFGNRKQVSDDIIEHPQNYHIYEGLSTLTNISRYDLPDPEVYKDFFRLHPVYEFQQLSATCTYFRGCPINRLDVAIAYDLPELVGKYKKSADEVLKNIKKNS